MESLPTRKTDGIYFYNINLLAVADVGKFIEIECHGEDLVEKEIESIIYVNRFIVNKTEHNSRIIFTKFSSIDIIVKKFNVLHELNCEVAMKGVSNFYSKEIFESYKARSITIDEYADELINDIKWILSDQEVDMVNSDFSCFDFRLDNEDNKVVIGFSASEELIEFLNQSQDVHEIATNWLYYYLNYKVTLMM